MLRRIHLRLSYREGLSFGFLIVIIIFTSLIYFYIFLNSRMESLRSEIKMANDIAYSWKELVSYTDKLLVSSIYDTIGLWENTYNNLNFKFSAILNLNTKNKVKKEKTFFEKIKLNEIIDVFFNKKIINYSDYEPLTTYWQTISKHVNIIKDNLTKPSLANIYYRGELLLSEYGKSIALGDVNPDLEVAVNSLRNFTQYSLIFSTKLENTVFIIEKRLQKRISILNNIMIVMSLLVIIIGLFFIYILLKKTKEHSRIESEMNAAAKIQSSLLPRQSETLAGYEIAHCSITATEVGGDNYDFCTTKTGNWISIGDVSGHGLRSGMIALISQAAFNFGVFILERIPSAIDPHVKMYNLVNNTLIKLNKIRNSDDAFMTQNYFFEKNGVFNCVGAHEIGLLYKKIENKVLEIPELSGRTAYMGFVSNLNSATSKYQFKMEKDDVLLLYTDGLIEAKNEKNELFDLGRVKKLLLQYSNEPVDVIKDTILENLREYCKNGDLKKHHNFFADDISMIVLRKQ